MKEIKRNLEQMGAAGRSSDDCGVFRLDKTSAHKLKNDVGLKLIESLFVVIEGRRLRFCAPGSEPHQGGQASAQLQTDPHDDWQALFEYHRINAEDDETIYLGTGGMCLGEGEMLGFDLHLELSRKYCNEKQLRLALGCASVTLVSMQPRREGIDDATCPPPFEKEDALKAKSAFLTLLGQTGGEPEKIRVYDLDRGDWLEPKDPLFEMLSPTLAVSAHNAMLFRFGTAGFGELRFFNGQACAV